MLLSLHDKCLAVGIYAGLAVVSFNQADGLKHGEDRVDGVHNGRVVVVGHLGPLAAEQAVVATHDTESIIQVIQDGDVTGGGVLAGNKGESLVIEERVQCSRVHVDIGRHGEQKGGNSKEQELGRGNSGVEDWEQELETSTRKEEGSSNELGQESFGELLASLVEDIGNHERNVLSDCITVLAQIQTRLHQLTSTSHGEQNQRVVGNDLCDYSSEGVSHNGARCEQETLNGRNPECHNREQEKSPAASQSLDVVFKEPSSSANECHSIAVEDMGRSRAIYWRQHQHRQWRVERRQKQQSSASQQLSGGGLDKTSQGRHDVRPPTLRESGRTDQLKASVGSN